MKRRVRLTERNLHRLIKESVRLVLREMDEDTYYLGGFEWDGGKQQPYTDYDMMNCTYEEAVNGAMEVCENFGEYPVYITVNRKGDNEVCDSYSNYSIKFAKRHNLPTAQNSGSFF